MRNVFDQYSQPENRLSHALAVALNEDRPLLRFFLKFAGVGGLRRRAQLGVIEQSLPGEVVETSDEEARNGLPDIVIYDKEGWCLAIESKLEAGLTQDQLKRHERTLQRRGMAEIHVLSITAKIAGHSTAAGRTTKHRHWTEVYRWLGQQRGPWAEKLREYMRVLESRLVREQYMKNTTLTEFDGFKFDMEHPYTAMEGRRLLKLIMKEIRNRPEVKRLGARVSEHGRSAITGTGSAAVWDFVPMATAKKGAANAEPHLTLSLTDTDVVVAVTIPNATSATVRKSFAGRSIEGFERLHEEILAKVGRLKVGGAAAQAYALQRHFKSQRSSGTDDARVSFDLRATVPGARGKVKYQPGWLEVFVGLLNQKKSNLQFGYEIRLPYLARQMRDDRALAIIGKAWEALRPVLNALKR